MLGLVGSIPQSWSSLRCCFQSATSPHTCSGQCIPHQVVCAMFDSMATCTSHKSLIHDSRLHIHARMKGSMLGRRCSGIVGFLGSFEDKEAIYIVQEHCGRGDVFAEMHRCKNCLCEQWVACQVRCVPDSCCLPSCCCPYNRHLAQHCWLLADLNNTMTAKCTDATMPHICVMPGLLRRDFSYMLNSWHVCGR